MPINSNPPGADVYIDGKNYGQTPAFIELKPSKNYKATISKRGYGSTNIDMDTWYSVRDGDGGDGGRCLADSVAVLPIMIVLLFAPEKCGSFKQSDYFVDLSGGKPVGDAGFGVPQTNNQNGGQNNNYSGNTQSQYQNNYYQNPPQQDGNQNNKQNNDQYNGQYGGQMSNQRYR